MISYTDFLSLPMTTVQTLYYYAYLDSLADAQKSEEEKIAKEIQQAAEDAE